jgi:hypothetical protein
MLGQVRYILEKNSPNILLGLGLSGFVSTVVMAISATPKAVRLVDNNRGLRPNVNKPDGYTYRPIIDKKDIFKLTWRLYVPTALMGAASIGLIVASHMVTKHRYAALAGMYGVTKTALSEYQKKVIEIVGDKKARKIDDELVEDKIKAAKNPSADMLVLGESEVLCFDVVTGRYFKAKIEGIKKVVNELNYRLLQDMFVTLDDFYSELGLDNIKDGNMQGWSVDDGPIDLRFSSKLTKEGTPCLVVDYSASPKWL